MLKLAENVFAIDLCAYLPDIEALIIADLHLGYEEALGKRGVLVPRTQFKAVIKRLEWILKKVKVKRVILNGDVKHEFGIISKQEWREVLRLLDFFKEKNIEVIVVKGNHDTILGPIARKREVKEVKEFRHKDILIVHGDYEPVRPAKVIIIGHEHPAISLKEGAKYERFKCFLKGPYKKSVLIAQPAFFPLTTGTDVLNEPTLSPLLKNLSKFEAFVVDDETHDVLPFGKLKKLN
jgi:putative SbcD/Mre11-related phosphoesterase